MNEWVSELDNYPLKENQSRVLIYSNTSAFYRPHPNHRDARHVVLERISNWFNLDFISAHDTPYFVDIYEHAAIYYYRKTSWFCYKIYWRNCWKTGKIKICRYNNLLLLPDTFITEISNLPSLVLSRCYICICIYYASLLEIIKIYRYNSLLHFLYVFTRNTEWILLNLSQHLKTYVISETRVFQDREWRPSFPPLCNSSSRENHHALECSIVCLQG